MRGINHPWLTNKVKKLMNERDCVLKKARHTNKEIFWSEYKTLRNRVNNTIKMEKANFSRRLIRDNIDDSKSFWKAINNILPSKKKTKRPISTITYNNKVMTEKSSIAESFNQFFSSIVRHISVQMMEIGTQINPPNLHTERTMLFTDAVFRFNPVDLDSVRSQLLKLKPNKGRYSSEIC